MRTEAAWLNDALASKELVQAMTHYRVKDRMMTATNGRFVAGHPCDIDGEFLVPGDELQQIFKRLPDEPKVKVENGKVTLRCGKFSGSLELMPPEEWRFPELGEVTWRTFPQALLPALADLRPFISNDAVHRWSLGIALDHGWIYASNNVVLAGAPCEAVADLQLLIPEWVVDFILERRNGLRQWCYNENFLAFKWDNGAWMRSTLIDDKFPARAGEMIRDTPRQHSQRVSAQYRQAVQRIAGLSEDLVTIYEDKVEGRTARSRVVEEIESVAPEGGHSLWSAKHLGAMMAVTDKWSPDLWPRPTPFRGERVQGYILGRTG